MSGWIKIHRSITNHWLYTEKRKFSKFEAWNDMLLTTNYSDAKTIIKGKLYEVKRGQSILSLDSWAKRWNWDKSAVRRFFNLLEKDGMIIVESDTATTHLTICKYEDYQQSENASETQKKRRRNTDEIQTTPIKEEKESKEEKDIFCEQKKHSLIKWLELNAPTVQKLSQPITNEQAIEIESKYNAMHTAEVFESMQNYKGLQKKYDSAYITFKNWVKNRQKENPNYGLKEDITPKFKPAWA